MSLLGDWLTWGTAAALGYLAPTAPPEDPYAKARARALAKSSTLDPGWLAAVLGARRTKSGEKVSPDNSISIASVFACTKVLSEDVAKLSWSLKRRLPSGGSEVVTRHPIAKLLRQVSPLVSNFKFKQIMMNTAILYGGGFAVIRRDTTGRIVELVPLSKTPYPTVQGSDLYWHVTFLTDWERLRFDGLSFGLVNDMDMLRVPGWGIDIVLGQGVPLVGREPIGTQMAVEEHAARFFSNGTNIGGTLEHPARLSKDAQDRLKASIADRHQGPSRAHNLMVLEEGLKYNSVGVDAEKAQLTETRRFGVEEMARLFRMPPPKIQDYSRATFNNFEESNLAYSDDVIMPWVINWQDAMNMRLLTQGERDAGLFIEFDLEGLRQANMDTRTKAAKDLVAAGLITVNEGRERLGINPIEGGDVFLRPVNQAPVQEEEQQTPSEPSTPSEEDENVSTTP